MYSSLIAYMHIICILNEGKAVLIWFSFDEILKIFMYTHGREMSFSPLTRVSLMFYHIAACKLVIVYILHFINQVTAES